VSRRPGSNLAREREIARALTEMKTAREQVDETVDRICEQHEPMGWLPVVLALVTGAIVAAVMARSVRWYVSVSCSLGGAAVMLIVLYVFRVLSWMRHHPLLALMFKLKHVDRHDEDADYHSLELAEAIVRRYLPPQQGEPLLARLEEAEHRTANLVGLDDEVPEPGGRVGS
jgi:hypothetical protein